MGSTCKKSAFNLYTLNIFLLINVHKYMVPPITENSEVIFFKKLLKNRGQHKES